MQKPVEVILERQSANDLEATIVEILCSENGIVDVGQVIFVVETSKATQEICAPIKGLISYSLAIGDIIKTGSTVAEIWPASSEVQSNNSTVVPDAAGTTFGLPAAVESRSPRLSRNAAALAAEFGLEPQAFNATFVTKKDVEQHISTHSRPEVSAPESGSPPSKLKDGYSPRRDHENHQTLPAHKRGEIGVLSRGAAASMLSIVGVSLEGNQVLRKNEGFFSTKILDLVVHVASRMMRKYPKFNAKFYNDGIMYHEAVTPGVAFDDVGRLVTYGIARADALSLEEIQSAILVGFEKFSKRKLSAEEIGNATFTVTDLSSSEVDFVLPLLPEGQSCIIGITRSSQRGYSLYVGFDHRVTEGLEASRFLKELRDGIASRLTDACSTNSSSPLQRPKSSLTGNNIDERYVNEGTRKTVHHFVVNTLSSLLEVTAPNIVPLALPIFELGLNSSNLVTLAQKINAHFGVALETASFFEHNTCERIVSFVCSQLSSSDAEVDGGFKNAHSHVDGTANDLPERRILGPSVRWQNDDVAIVGVACRLPGDITTPHQFWRLLEEGRQVIGRLPHRRFTWPATIDPESLHRGIDFGGFLQDVDCFDPAFFRISPREAQTMDPQQRLLLQLAWSCLEDAGHSPRTFAGTDTGMFVGASGSDYQLRLCELEVEGHFGLGTSTAILANRISYFYDLRGPSVQVDTACSASLVAVHEAVQALNTGACDQALVAGINVICHPANSIAYYKAGMLAKDGKCKTFDESSDGYVRAEGGVMLLLKPIASALQDGDQVYGVIKGSSVNHGGQAAGLTVPSPQGQADLIRKAFIKSRVSPNTVNYVETHGTGTSLGDPIEIRGLKQAFATGDFGGAGMPWCGLASVKTNIGHLEAAAGIAGLLKVLLCMQHRKLPPSLNFNQLNSHISLDGSPFYIVDSLREWELLADCTSRRAGVSSFGSGGTNAHIIIEEYVPAPRASAPVRPHGPVAVVLSAKNEERLQAQAAQLIQAVEARGFTDADLADIAYTLQIGREAMEVRLALVADSLEEMTSKLHRYSQGDEQIEGLYRGEVRRAKDMLAPFNADEDLRKAIEAWVAKGKLSKLLDLWVKGLAFDWNSLYAAHKPRRISLPTYPFARERYWVPANATEDSSAATASVAAVLHPLLHENTSDLWGQRFRTRFGGEEFFLRDHVVQGEKVLPAAAQLEMARAAVSRAARDEAGDGGLHLRDVAWARPVRLGSAPLELHVGVYTEDDGAIAYEILGGSDGDGEPVVYGQGRALLAALDAPPAVDIAGVRAQCERTMSASECYAAFEALGISYGPAHRGMTALHVGSQQALARLELPAGTATAEYVLHPSLMDAALQATLGLRLDASSQAMLELPFAVEAVDILSAVPAQAWAWVRFSAGSNAASAVGKLDIDLCDEQGRVCVSMRGFSTRAVQGQLGAEEDGTLLMRRLWRPQAATTGDEPGFVEHRVVLFDAAEDYRADITAALPGVECLVLGRTEASIAQRYETGVERVLEALQSIVRQRPKGAVLLQVVVALTGEGALLEGLSGLLKTARLENPNLVGQVIGLEAGTSASTVVAQLLENAATPAAQQIRYRSGERLVLDWEELPSGSDGRQPWRDRGVYLITGGAGGLGLIFAREIASRVKDPTLILVGRSALSVAKQAELAALETLGARVQYQRLDVSDGAAVTALVAQIRQAHGELTGIVHGAGVIKDSFLVKKTADEVRAVLSPKVAGVVNLDEATRDVALEFMILFASGSGALGNVGQGDYAAANAFLEGYASYRNGLVASGNRQGRTLAIAWPLWRHGGMQVDAAVAQLQQQQGVVPLSTQRGLQAFYGAYVAGDDQVLVLSGEVNRLRASLLQQGSPAPQEASLPNDSFVFGAEPEQLKEKTLERLKGLLAEATKLALSQIDVEEPLESYGIDSIMITRLNHKFGEIFGELSKTLLYEYQTLDSLADYLVGQHAAACARWSGLKKAVPAQPPLPRAADARQEGFAALSRMKLPRARSRTSTQASSRLDRVPIAIIGLDGRYPKAANLDAYWQNLEAGRDCIGEIPSERWPLSGFYHPDPQEATAQGKSYSKWGGFLEGFAEFDPLFFSIPPLQAENMDPQERLFLQCAYAVLEDAGYTRQRLTEAHQRRVGVFAGITTTGFDLYGPELWRQGQTSFPYTSFSSLANRVSYFFDLQGPSLPIDTMCSSSLTAIHEACEHLLRGECELAIAGGVNLFLHPASYVTRSAQRMLSGDGRCKSFGKGGNGYVPGEGVGAVLLKPLPRAIEDDDQIYGVIRATSINHGGKTNGYTVPNPTAQRELVREAMEKAGIDARTISYIEAHGTGTELGDPIEITGLAQAFQQDTTDAQFCAIGSVKSNIGHLEAAAGIAAVTKVLLQLKHQQLAPSLHAEELNPNIDFAKTPFTVQQSLGPWARPVVEIAGRRQEYPRIAGISSFGAGGANAHIIIEEYVPAPRASAPVRPHGPVAVVLSAKNEERLQAQAAQLIQAVEARGFTDADLADIAYTLQIGREAMEVRLALVADSLEEMTSKLHRYSQGDEQIEGLYRGEVRRAKDMLAPFNADEDLRKAIEAWVAKGKLSKLLDLWVKGLAFDWNSLYAAHKPRRISLPTYPFARERYWVPANATEDSSAATASVAAVLHPLLHENTSDLWGQRFRTRFGGEEFFLRDHVVQGEKVLPAAAQLEMARAAVSRAARDEAGDGGLHLRDVAWARPVRLGSAPLELHVGVYTEDDGAIAYEILGGSDGDGEPVVYGQGRALLAALDAPPAVDIAGVRAQCERTMSASECYAAFEALGISYGPAHRGMTALHVGSQQALARLELPAGTATAEYVLHPSLMDAALQATLGLRLDASSQAMLELPFAVEAVDILSAVPAQAWAWVRFSAGSNAASAVGKLDIDLCDEQGRVCVSMRGFSTQGLDKIEVQSGLVSVCAVDEAPELMTFEEVWQAQDQPSASMKKLSTVVCFLSDPDNQQLAAEVAHRIDPKTKVIFVGQGATYQKHSSHRYDVCRSDGGSFRKLMRDIHTSHGVVDAIIYMWGLEDASCLSGHAEIVHILQSIASTQLKCGRLLLSAAFETEVERCFLESWIGFERSLDVSWPQTKVAVIGQEHKGPGLKAIEEWIERLWSELQADKIESAIYRAHSREVCRLSPRSLDAGESLLRSGGVYLITGGCGGLGSLFAEYLAKTRAAKLILTGRSPLNEEKLKLIKALETYGSEALYLQTDICDQTGLEAGLRSAEARFGALNGVIHAAGIRGRESVFEADVQQFWSVTKPKIEGTLVLDRVLRGKALDFICYFSSSAAILGDFGSCDYAIGNRFMMAHAHSRNRDTQQGKAIVINWGLWNSQGMAVGNAEQTHMYLKSSGQRELEAEEGTAIFERALSSTATQYLVLVGQPSRVRRFLRLEPSPATEMTPPQSPDQPDQGQRSELKGLSVAQCVAWDLKEEVSRLLKVPRERVGMEENLADFGFDSVSLAEFSRRLTRLYGIEVSPTVFFSYPTLEKLVEYFVSAHELVIKGFYAEKPVLIPPAPNTVNQTPLSSKQNRRRSRLAIAPPSSAVGIELPEPIAIIGMSGRFPKARTVDELWQLLAARVNAVEEIPADRFDWRKYFGNPQEEPGKTDCKWAGILPGVAEFDPLFFEISPREAEMMDPRQRLLLQEAWRALEDAGYGAQQISGHKIGTFVGVEQGDYQALTNGDGGLTATHEGILAARLAYFLDLRGPTMAINTACSSALVALHQACMSLRNGDCDTALAAGVSLLLTPQVHIKMAQAGMLSKDGTCYAFDRRANGTVPSEAVSVVVLKRLSQAELDGDPIHAVICGSGINYDGKTNGITAPSGVAQTSLIRDVHDRHGVNPEEIDYIVTHGTATVLGDPIEINALHEAFKSYTDRQGFCALTSSKTNLGHTLAASGLVSLVSLVQALRHETIPASLHCEEENEYINWQSTPFYINKNNRPWLHKGEERRLGAVSAFGMSGTNAHVLVQDYRPRQEVALELPPFFILALSAKTETALQEKIKDAIAFLKKNPSAQDLHAMSYTLLCGRQHFGHRCAIVVQDHEDALHLWGQFGAQDRPVNLFQGQVLRTFTPQKALQQYSGDLLTRIWPSRKDRVQYQEMLCALADLYCQGYELDWNSLYAAHKPRRISLPTYPFARERYWVPANATEDSSAATASVAAVLHPLLHENTSDFSRQRFSSTFSGDEFFLKGHLVQGVRVMPGVTHLEMVRAALMKSFGTMLAEQSKIRLTNVGWIRPIMAEGDPIRAHVELISKDNGEIAYAIYSQTSDGPLSEPRFHSRGHATILTSPATPIVDLVALQAQCSQTPLTPDECYQALRAVHITHGPAYQCITALRVGADNEGQPQALARLELPDCVKATGSSYMLHPSMMDAATTAMVGLGLLAGLAIPFAVEAVDILSAVPAQAWAWVRFSAGSNAASAVGKLDIDLCDEQGRVCVSMRGFSTRAVQGQLGAEEDGTLLMRRLWRPQAATTGDEPGFVEHRVVLFDAAEDYRADITAALPGVECLVLGRTEASIAQRYETGVERVLEALQSIVRQRPKGAVLLQVVVALTGEGALLEGLSGLLKTARLENPNLVGQVIGLEAGTSASTVVAQLLENAATPAAQQIRYRSGERLVLDWEELPSGSDGRQPWRDRGVYLITGGAGGLGLIFAREIASRVKDPTLILVGRSALSVAKQAELAALETLGARVQYQRLDVSDGAAVTALVAQIRQAHGELTGIVHGAGVIKDSFLVKKTADEVRAVLSPKVAGVVNLDEATRDVALEFMILFASGSGALGNVGQGDYAAANAFLEGYASYRNGLVASGNRQGRTLAIAWPLWRHGGMQVDAAVAQLQQQQGVVPLSTQRGLQAFYGAYVAGDDQVLVLSGEVNRLRASLLQQGSPAPQEASLPNDSDSGPSNATGSDLEARTLRYLTQALASSLKLPAARLDEHAPLGEYGVDSVIALQLTHELEKSFGSLSKTLLFEYQSIRELTQYFLETHRPKLNTLLGGGGAAVTASVAEPPVAPLPRMALRETPPRAALLRAPIPAERHAEPLDIAIIGVSGRYPGARNLEEFWENLRNGRDCITEVPKERWDHSLYFDPDRDKQGKTYCKWGGFIDGVDQFDPLFFNMSPREAELLDPQERLFLQCVYEALEDAAYTRTSLARYTENALDVGVYVGVMHEEYQLYAAQAQVLERPVTVSGSPSSVANRVSYFFDFHGPSIAVDTMCSGALTAIDLACHSLWTGGCKLAIAGGVNVSIHPNKFLLLAHRRLASGTGRCESFGEGGDGYVPGEGVGAVILKPLAKAVLDEDQIYGVIKSTAINHGGRTGGFTTPNPGAQTKVIESALQRAGIDSSMVSYVEAAANGSALGDAIEATALIKAFANSRSGIPHCAIGSVKSNIGHCESAAGIAAVTKVLLQLKHQQLAPSLHAEELNPNIDFAKTPFTVQQSLGPWARPVVEIAGRRQEYPRIAGISSFGAGGANAHIIIEEYVPAPRASAPVRPHGPVAVVLSAKNEERLQAQAAQLIQAVEARGFTDADLADIAYTLQIGREAMEVRLALVADSLEEMTSKLHRYSQGDEQIEGLYRGEVRRAKDMLAPFNADEDLRKAIEAWVAKGKLSKLLDLWVKGLAFDWNSLYAAHKPRRISLPTYPFARERYWPIEMKDTLQSNRCEPNPSNLILHPLLHEETK
ncbi:SDR family NAD(P)-dependent oxidoreductase [Rhizobium leguminosarum]|uniref:SDR family NAD(P)-dependent oxidoreductase n=1 Tax=Rhizobium leguminosarum TaxID=384 RepID=UPI003ECE601D